MKTLETQLRTWAPRRPSPRIRHRLFATQAAASQEKTPSFHLRWLVPVTAVLLLMGALFNQHNDAIPGSAKTGPLVAMILSNQSAAAYLPGNFSQDRNRISDTFEWTNLSGSALINGSLPRVKGTH